MEGIGVKRKGSLEWREPGAEQGRITGELTLGQKDFLKRTRRLREEDGKER